MHFRLLLRCLLPMLLPGVFATAQSTVGWLRYAVPPDPPRYHGLPHAVALLGNSSGQPAPEELVAADELDRGLGHMVAGTDVVTHRFDPRIDSIVLGTTEALHRARLGRTLRGWTEKQLPEEGFRIVHLRRGVREWYVLQGGSPRAELWAAFRFAALVAEDQQLPEDFTDAPHFLLRAVDMGRASGALPLLQGVEPGATVAATDGKWPRDGLLRLLASVGVNAVFVEGEAPDAARVAAMARPFGIRVWLRPAAGAAAPIEPILQLAASTPNFGGLLLPVPKDASLPQLRALLQTANTEAQALRRYGAAVVLENALGPPLREPSDKTGSQPGLSPEERAAALRGSLEPNVILSGAAMPLFAPLSGLGSANFGLLPGVPQLAAVDLLPRRFDTLAYPAAAWKAALQTPERGTQADTTLAALLGGSGEAAARGGMVGKLSPADAEHLLHQPLLQANLYAFGRLAWSPALQAEAVTEEWSRQTWGDDARAHAVATAILLASGRASASNSAPMGLPLLTDTAGGPDPAQAAQLQVAGLPIADGSALGMDRTSKGTNEVARYPETFARQLQDVNHCPEEWLLLLHRLPYRFVLPSGKTVAQTVYDAHFSGAAAAANAADAWESTRGLVDEPRYAAVHAFLAQGATQAEIWREVSTEWMQQTSGVPDTLGFVGSHPGRVEAENMQASGSVRIQAERYASHGEAVLCREGDCTLTTTFTGHANVYRVEVGYADEHSGCFELLVNGESRARWQALSEGTAVKAERFVVNGVRLQPGDALAIRVVAAPGGSAAVDFVEITRDPRWN